MKKRWFTVLTIAVSIFMAALPVHAEGSDIIFMDHNNDWQPVYSQLIPGDEVRELYVEGYSSADTINWYLLDENGNTLDFGYVGGTFNSNKYDYLEYKYFSGVQAIQVVLECSGGSCEGSASITVR